jgi:hypothetical protein
MAFRLPLRLGGGGVNLLQLLQPPCSRVVCRAVGETPVEGIATCNPDRRFVGDEHSPVAKGRESKNVRRIGNGSTKPYSLL